MKYISGNLSEEDYTNLLKTFDPTEEDVLDKKLPHVGLNRGSKFFGNCIFGFKFQTSSPNTQIQIIPQGMEVKKVLIDGEKVEPENNSYTFSNEGTHVVKIFSSDIWTSIEGTFINGWTNLKEIEFPSSIEDFDSDSIVGCSGLEKLKFGKKIQEINGDLSTLGLREIEISERNRNLKVIEGKYIVSRKHPDTLLGTVENTIPTSPQIKKFNKEIYAGKTLTNFVIPGNIKELGESAFEGCTFIGSLTLGEGLRKIDSKAFYNIDLNGLDTLILNSETPPEIIDPEYFDIKDIDENGDSIEGVEFEVEGILNRYVTSLLWKSKLSELSKLKYQYLTFEAVEDAVFTCGGDVYYSVNSGNTWVLLPSNTQTPTISAGNKIQWKGAVGINISYTGSGQAWWGVNNRCRFTSTGKFNASGNPLSIIYNDNFISSSAINSDYLLAGLFYNNSKLISARDVYISLSLINSRYSITQMFSGCTSLTAAPELPATTLADYCYFGMFNHCTSLTTAPELPATTLAERCYMNMFSGCTSLTTVPELPATTLSDYCYNSMFQGCTSLTTASELPATTLAQYCYYNMFYSCTSLTTAPELPATTLTHYCYCQMFSGCTSLTTTPELPATTLANSCYLSMFIACTSLTTASELPATTLAQGCYSSMFNSCTSLTKAPSILPATTLAEYCYQNMFYGCTALTTAPELPATTLVSNCYRSMFFGCRSLNYIKAMFLTTPETNYTNSWVSEVASTGTFIKNSAATWNVIGVNGVPGGWNVVNEVEYLQPSGQAYIDTGITLPDRIKFKYKFSAHVQYGFFFGNYVSENHNTFRVIDSRDGNGNLLLYPNTKAGAGATSIPVGDLNTVHTIDMSQGRIEYDEIVFSGQINTTQGTDNNTNLVIFANKSGGSVQNLQHRIYFFQIWKNNELVRDLIPVRQGTTGYMCDRVSGQLFGNVGSGNFTLGPDL